MALDEPWALLPKALWSWGVLGGPFLLHPLAEVADPPSLCQPGIWSSPRKAPVKSQSNPACLRPVGEEGRFPRGVSASQPKTGGDFPTSASRTCWAPCHTHSCPARGTPSAWPDPFPFLLPETPEKLGVVWLSITARSQREGAKNPLPKLGMAAFAKGTWIRAGHGQPLHLPRGAFGLFLASFWVGVLPSSAFTPALCG